MKKRFISFLLLMCLLLSACQSSGSTAVDVLEPEENLVTEEAADMETLEGVDTADTLSLEDYLAGLDSLESPSKEYGENAAYIDMDEDLVVRVLYPFGEIEALDQAVEDWVFQTVSNYREEATAAVRPATLPN